MSTYKLSDKAYLIYFITRAPLLILFTFIVVMLIKYQNAFLINLSDDSTVQNLLFYLKYGVIFLLVLFCIFLLWYIFIQPYFLKKRSMMLINEHRIEYRTGALFYKTIYIPLINIQQIEINTNFLKQSFNASSISISTSFISLDTGPIDTLICEQTTEYILNFQKQNKGEHDEN